MENPDVIRRLEKLTLHKREILKCYCHGMSIQQIAEKYDIEKGTVRAHINQIYIKLELDLISVDARRAVLLRLYCEAFEKYVQGSEYEGETAIVDLSADAFEEEIEETEEEMTSEEKEREQEIDDMIDTDHRELIKVAPLEHEPIDDRGLIPTREETRKRTNPFQLILFIFALIGFAAVSILAYELITGRLNLIPVNLVETDPVSPVQITEEMQVSPTKAIAPTELPTTVEIVPTEAPTLAPTTPPKPEILFEDDFETGLAKTWEVVSGNPIVVNGMLTADQNTWVVVGDPTWTNYSVEFTASSKYVYYNWGSNFTAVRMNEMDNMYVYEWVVSQSRWHIVENGGWNEVPQSEFRPGSDFVNYRIVVNGTSITTYIDGVQKSSFFDDRFLQGRVGIMITEETMIDDFKVREILE